MNPTSPSHDATANTLRVDTHPVTLHLLPGSTVFAVRGEAWITQDGLCEDIIVTPGRAFVVPGRGSLVISATRDAADLFIVRPELARAHPATDVFDFARSQAAALRRAEIVRVAGRAAALWRSLVAQLRGAPILRPRVTSS
jgi:hypothetical protein